ncbi:hypothetical protein OHA61_18770 [Streptomyces sp. NBC_00885]|nr:hypothetical protein OHA61_18770 [Streptomyces sp. NBC_00885]
MNALQPSPRDTSAVGVIVILLLRGCGEAAGPARTMESVAPL